MRASTATAAPINPNIQKDNEKVVDTVLTSSVGKQVRRTLSGIDSEND